jgi:NitT/TauT family transport system substrate-binding protein
MLLALLLTGCSPETNEPLRVASSPWPGYEPLYLAREIGYLPSNQANIFELPSSDITLQSFINRSADMATLTLDETLDLLHSGVKLRVLLVMDTSHGADAVMVTPRIKQLSDLKGKRIVIENIPLGVYILSRLLDKAKLARADVQVIQSPESKHEELYRNNKADAFITFEPHKTHLAALGAHDIFNSSDIPNEIFDLLVVHEDVYKQRRKEVCNIARQWFRTLDFMKHTPQQAEILISKRLGVTVSEYRAMVGGINTPTLQENLRQLGGENPEILKPAGMLNEVMLKEGQLPRAVHIGAGLDPALKSCFAD